MFFAGRRDVAIYLVLWRDVSIDFVSRRDVAVAVALRAPRRTLAAARTLESRVSATTMAALTAAVRAALRAVIRLAEFRMMRARAAALPRRSFVAITARRITGNRQRRASKR